MRSGLSQAQEEALMRPAADIMPPPAVAATTKEIPYDYVAKFKLQGKAGNRVQDVINISTEGAFVAVAIGYSFIPARLDRFEFPGAASDLVFSTLAPNPIGFATWQCLLVKLCGIDFKYSIVDSGTGRELQNQSIHNIAGLGESSGDRPFRPLAKPMLFMPRSTIRIEVEEISEGLDIRDDNGTIRIMNRIGLPIYGYDVVNPVERIGSELFIVLHGYKTLGYGTALP